MNKSRIILTIIGFAALAVPVVLLIVFSSKAQLVPAASTQGRTIDTKKVEETARRLTPSPSLLPEPSVSVSPVPLASPATSSATVNDN